MKGAESNKIPTGTFQGDVIRYNLYNIGDLADLFDCFFSDPGSQYRPFSVSLTPVGIRVTVRGSVLQPTDIKARGRLFPKKDHQIAATTEPLPKWREEVQLA